MSVFSDDDLKRLKGCDSVDGWHRIESSTFDALLARLEKAERCVEVLESLDATSSTVNAWRKSKGL